MRQFSLSTKLTLVILSAILIPLLLLGTTSFISARIIALENLEAFVTESGSRRQQAIEKEMNNASNILQEFMRNNEETLAQSFLQRGSGEVNTEQGTLEDQIGDLFSSELIQTGYFNSVSLMQTNLNPFATTARAGIREIVSFTGSDIGAIRSATRSIREIDELVFAFVATNRNREPHIEVIHAIYATVDDEPILQGYLLAELDLDTIVIENLANTEGIFETYTYLILPSINEVIATEEVIEANLIDINSGGATSALAGRVETITYSVGDEDNRRVVLGYADVINAGTAEFALVTEVNTDVVSNQLLNQAVSRIFFPLFIGTSVLMGLLLFITYRMVVPPINRLRQAVLGVVRGNFDAPVPDSAREDEMGALATSFIDMRDYVRNLTDEMNRKLLERTRDVQVTQDISRAVTAEHDAQRLMDRVVNLIVEKFSTIYHAQIFLIDSEGKYAVLRSSTGEAGKSLLGRGHKLAVGSVSVIGQVTEQGQVVIARDTVESDVHHRNEFLRETLAELAIPLRLGSEIIGSLDVQSKERDSFDPDQVSALQTLADQITIAIENARLYAESARLLTNIGQERSATTRINWQEYMYEQRQKGVEKQSGTKTAYDFSALTQAVYSSGKAIVGDSTERNTIPFVVPIILRGQILGVAEYEVSQENFTYDKVLLAEELVSRMSISLENARLFQSSKQAVERERVVNEISSKLTAQTDIESILQTAIREIGQALRTPQVAIRLQTPKSNSANGNGTQQPTNGTSIEELSS
jgi:GAF domain-containing protein/HAMP domain-containing protein